MLRRLCVLLFVLLSGCFFVTTAGAEIYGPMIDTLPSGTVVTMQRELTIPANRDYIILGFRLSDQINNSLLQPYNQVPTFSQYNDYRTALMQNYEQSYQGCIETHRRYITTGGGSGSNVTVNQNTRVGGHNNTVVNNTTIVNQGSPAPYQTYSYIAPNDCIPPEYTLTTLVVKRSGRERLIADGKSFRVKKVKLSRSGIFNEVIIRFDHEVVVGLVVFTTHDPRSISMYALDKSDGSFLGNMHNALLGIGGENLSLELPAAEYIE